MQNSLIFCLNRGFSLELSMCSKKLWWIRKKNQIFRVMNRYNQSFLSKFDVLIKSTYPEGFMLIAHFRASGINKIVILLKSFLLLYSYCPVYMPTKLRTASKKTNLSLFEETLIITTKLFQHFFFSSGSPWPVLMPCKFKSMRESTIWLQSFGCHISIQPNLKILFSLSSTGYFPRAL